jgi:hypothetical protein
MKKITLLTTMALCMAGSGFSQLDPNDPTKPKNRKFLGENTTKPTKLRTETELDIHFAETLVTKRSLSELYLEGVIWGGNKKSRDGFIWGSANNYNVKFDSIKSIIRYGGFTKKQILNLQASAQFPGNQNTTNTQKTSAIILLTTGELWKIGNKSTQSLSKKTFSGGLNNDNAINVKALQILKVLDDCIAPLIPGKDKAREEKWLNNAAKQIAALR